MSVIHAPSRPKLDIRLLIFPSAMLALLIVLFFRIWYIQVVKAPELADRADASRQESIKRLAPRGLIYDRNGELLAGLRPEIVVSIVYSDVAAHPGEIENLANRLGTTMAFLKPKLDDARHTPGLPTPIIIGIKPELGMAIAEARAEFPGVDVDLMPNRYYTNGTDFSHILGVVRLPSKRDLERLAKLGLKDRASRFVGKSGIERSYEAELMGTPGVEVDDVDAKRKRVRVAERDNPVAGHDLIMSIDSKLQHIATQDMAQHGYIGAVVALDPSSGEVLCMVSSPTFNQNLFQQGISKDDYQKLVTDPNKPLISRATDSSYSPGSTFKIVTSIAAYEGHEFDPNRAVYCDSSFHLRSKTFKGFCLGHHGDITYQQALEKSCNVYFADLGFRVGEKQIRKTCAEVGLGETSGIDIGGEDLGLVPSDAYVAKHWRRQWFGGDTLNLSIGQGWLRASPLQMCDVAALVANDGVMYRPHLVRAIKDFSTGESRVVKPEVFHQVSAAPDFWATLKRALVGVIEVGTGRTAKIANVEWAGKTGSTEHGHRVTKTGKPPKTHSWFVGFAPADHPKIAICVFVEEAGHGGDIAAPIAKDVVEAYLKSARKVSASPTISAAAGASPSSR